MESNECEVCGNELPTGRRKVCSRRCSDRKDYLKNREKELIVGREKYKQKKIDPAFVEYHKIKSREWYQKNKQRQNNNLLKDYRRHKDKWISRDLTRKLLKQKRIFIEDKCKRCQCADKLQIHHEEYPATVQGIITAVQQQKIYKMCTICHKLPSPLSEGKGI